MKLMEPILMGDSQSDVCLRKILNTNFSHPEEKLGVLLLARNDSNPAIRIAEEEGTKLSWFSPDLIEHEEYAFDLGNKERMANLQIYTNLFVGSTGWDNAERLLGELGKNFAYDATTLAVNQINGIFNAKKISHGLSGLIEFDERTGSRVGEGIFFGVTALDRNKSIEKIVTLLQPSNWVLENIISISKSSESVISQPGTSTTFTRAELVNLANRSRHEMGCDKHILHVTTYDPFSQAAYEHSFLEDDLPEYIVLLNQHGFGIKVTCRLSEKLHRITSVKIACTPKNGDVQCFQSAIKSNRSKRSSVKESDVIESRQGAAAKPDAKPEFDLRLILKAAKPFVGTCIGASTGCAMCVLVLGRLPLSAVPAICSGPCFVGTFGGCGALLARASAETTVICTELFRQGYLEVDMFVADAEFGKDMMNNNPTAMRIRSLINFTF
ncbi:hypothetical protein Fcan01_10889 [Folsomia candida]|uniref:Uncharacterized protein n=1 Tax=Folsomia candida TaxID=158441 RepID=A0A226E958_FOLCA|nr:hypothetical protein Fcan01_10889 [Folsomia candida]